MKAPWEKQRGTLCQATYFLGDTYTHTHTSSGLCLKLPWSHEWNWGQVHLLSFFLVSKVPPPPVPEEARGGRRPAMESDRHPCH